MLHQSWFIILLIFPCRLIMDHRPFWWVQETDVYGKGPRPVLRQTPLTCETGPGSPSGHMQGLSSLMYVVLQHFICTFIKSSMKMDNRKKNCVRIALWTLYILLMILVGISRLYTATHFPHQTLLGLLAGSVTLICKTVVWSWTVEMWSVCASRTQTQPYCCNIRLF
jgi:membrane-associated phospholipid phosphatase